MKVIFLLLFLFHGLFHLYGAVSALELMRPRGNTPVIPRSQASLWLLAFLMLTIGGLGMASAQTSWWMPALAGIAFSQFLIARHWKSAWAGTLVNVILFALVVLGWGSWQFDRDTADIVLRMHGTEATQYYDRITTQDLDKYPAPVARWLKSSGIAGNKRIQRASLSQNLSMQMEPGQEDWFEAIAHQEFVVNPPAFVWDVILPYKGVFDMKGRDVLLENDAQMLITINGLFSVVNATGPEIDEASMQRYLAEIVWLPTAAMDPNIHWEQIDAVSARATLSNGGQSVSGIFHFDEKGDMVRFETQRYFNGDKGNERIPWVITSKAFGSPGGMRVPVELECTWLLDDGPWTWLNIRLDSIQYDFQE